VVLTTPAPAKRRAKPAPALKPFYSLHEAAAILGIAYVTAWQWVDQGKLKAIRLPSHKRQRIRVPGPELVRIMSVSLMPHIRDVHA
jgi:hypothetical protein